MGRWPGLLLVLMVGSCGGEPAVPASVAERPEAAEPRRERERVAPRPEPATGSGADRDDVTVPGAGTTGVLRRLTDPSTREAAEQDLREMTDAERIAFLRRGMAELPPDLALEAAKRLEYQYLDAAESERFVRLLLPHLFAEADDIDFEELRGTLGSAEIWDVLQEMREHESVAGERSLLGALHRQLRAEHLPALVEMALSSDPALAEQAFEEIAIVATYTNRHRRDVARIFAGRADAPERTYDVPAELVVALRAILADDEIGEVRRSMYLAWGLRWLRDCKDGGGGDRLFLRELIATARTAPGLGDWERDNVQICALLGLAEKDARWIREELEEHPEAWSGDAALAARTIVLANRNRAEARSLAGAVPLALAVLLELDDREGEYALFDALHGRKAHAALEFMDDVYHARFRFRLGWGYTRPRRLEPRQRAGPGADLDPALMLRLAILYPEFDGHEFVAPFLRGLAEPGALARSAAGRRDLHDGVLPSLEGDALRELLRNALVDGTAEDRVEAARLLALLRDRPSEQALIDLVLAGQAQDGVMADVAEWASSGGRERIRAWLPADESEFEMQTLAALGGLSRALARELGEETEARLRDGADHSVEVVGLLREGDAIGALLLHLDVNVHDEIDGIGRVDDPRVRAHLRTWARRREDGRAHWAIGELALSGDSSAVRDIEDVVEIGRYRWVDDAAAEVLLLGGANRLGYWVQEAESNCCRAVPVKRVFEEALRVNVTEEMGFQPGVLVTLAEWLCWRLGESRDWRLREQDHPESSSFGRPARVRGLVWSDIEDGYVPSLRR